MTTKTDDKPYEKLPAFEEYSRKLGFGKPATLEEYHRQKEGKPALTVLKPYAAFDVKRTMRLEIKRAVGMSQAPAYRALLNVGYNGDQGTEIVLYYTFMVIKIKGKDMQEITHALIEGKCKIIREYHKNEYIAPAPDAPIITSIELFTEKK
jgi:hypothetical protein